MKKAKSNVHKIGGPVVPVPPTKLPPSLKIEVQLQLSLSHETLESATLEGESHTASHGNCIFTVSPKKDILQLTFGDHDAVLAKIAETNKRHLDLRQIITDTFCFEGHRAQRTVPGIP